MNQKSLLMTTSVNNLVALRYNKSKGLIKLLTDPYAKVYIFTNIICK